MPTTPKSRSAERLARNQQDRKRRLLATLADGAFHSGEALAKQLRISRGGIWKLIGSLRALGIDVQSVPRVGYRLAHAVDLLDEQAIAGSLSPEARRRVERVDVALSVDSTNRRVAEAIFERGEAAQACLAEIQSAGRGRRGRSWVAPFGSGICFSMGWTFPEVPPSFSALGLAVGVAAIRALRRFGAAGVGLKWPNDLVWQRRKLGGILIEMRGETAGPAHVVIGIGINMKMPSDARLRLAEQHAVLVADVHEILKTRTPSRNALVAALIDELVGMLEIFSQQGFAAFISEWSELDTLADAPVRVLSGNESVTGIARGVQRDGSLLVEVQGELRTFISGEVSLRAA